MENQKSQSDPPKNTMPNSSSQPRDDQSETHFPSHYLANFASDTANATNNPSSSTQPHRMNRIAQNFSAERMRYLPQMTNSWLPNVSSTDQFLQHQSQAPIVDNYYNQRLEYGQQFGMQTLNQPRHVQDERWINQQNLLNSLQLPFHGSLVNNYYDPQTILQNLNLPSYVPYEEWINQQKLRNFLHFPFQGSSVNNYHPQTILQNLPSHVQYEEWINQQRLRKILGLPYQGSLGNPNGNYQHSLAPTKKSIDSQSHEVQVASPESLNSSTNNPFSARTFDETFRPLNVNSNSKRKAAVLESSSSSSSSPSFAKIDDPTDFLLKMIESINSRLVDTQLEMCSHKDGDVTEPEGRHVVVCTYKDSSLNAPISIIPLLKLRLLVLKDYPMEFPTIDFPNYDLSLRTNAEDLHIKAHTRLYDYTLTLEKPMSLEEFAKAWEASARAVLVEYTSHWTDRR